jgi:5-formyltetrahydrofolate cyclo-ligase
VSDKSDLRRWAKALAPASEQESARVAEVAAEVLARNDWQIVLTFLAMPGEVDLSPLGRIGGLRLLVTRTPEAGDLTIHELTGELERHRLGYLQPSAGTPEVDPRVIEAVLVPGVLFDRRGGRLGHGRGYYDRLLGAMHPRPYLIGTTLDRRVVERLPMGENDVFMDAVITESGFEEVPACA